VKEREEIEQERRRIDDLDRRLVELLNERARCALAIGAIKRQLGLKIYDPGREQVIVTQAIDFNEGPLADDALRRLFERILDESRRMERMQHGGRTPDAPDPHDLHEGDREKS